MPTTALLNTYGSTTLSAAGAGTVALVPSRLETWQVTRIAVSSTSSASEPEADVYVGTMSPANFLGGTYSGSKDQSDEDVTIPPGTPLICVWTGGDPGAEATLSIFGTRTFGGP